MKAAIKNKTLNDANIGFAQDIVDNWKYDKEIAIASEKEKVAQLQRQLSKDAEANKESDKKKRELIDARNNADGMAHSTETQLKEHGDKISAEDKTAIENAIKDVQEATKTDDLQKIKDATTKLTTSAQKLGEAIYKQSQDQQPTQEANTTENKDDNVVDAEFEEVKK